MALHRVRETLLAKFPHLKASGIMPRQQYVPAAKNGIGLMQNDAAMSTPNDVSGDADILSFEVSDAALERAAGAAIPGGALSFPNAPTVSILIMCCSVEGL
jgi:hypothetical protein